MHETEADELDRDMPTRSETEIMRLPHLEFADQDEQERAARVLLGKDNGAAVLENIRHMAGQRQRSAHWATLYANICGWTGTKAQLLAWLMQQLGVGLVQAQNAVKQIGATPNNPDEIAEMARAYLGGVYYDVNGPGKLRPEAPAFRRWWKEFKEGL